MRTIRYEDVEPAPISKISDYTINLYCDYTPYLCREARTDGQP
jgi:hypothetical protein